MSLFFNILAKFLGIYSVLIVIRIILTWFGSTRNSGPVEILSRFTDPYLDWWRHHFKLQAGVLDLTPIIAMAALSVLQTVCADIARRGKISLGVILSVCLFALWSALSFILGFCIIVLALRLIAYFTNSNMYSPFWQVIETISRSILYRVNRIIFGKRLVKYTTGLFTAIAVLIVILAGGRFAVQALAGFLIRLV